VGYTQEKNIYGTICENDRTVLPNRIYVFQWWIEEARSEKREREREKERTEKKGGVTKRRDACTRTFTSNMWKQCVKSCMDRGSFLEKANLFWWESHIRVVVAVYANKNKFSFISASLIVSNKVYTHLRPGANIAFEQKYLNIRILQKYRYSFYFIFIVIYSLYIEKMFFFFKYVFFTEKI